MRNINKWVITFTYLIFLANYSMGQANSNTLSIGYYAPYGIQFGAKLGASFTLKNWDKESESSRVSKLSVQPQISYFVFPDVQHNVLLNNEIVYSLHKVDKRFFPMVSVGTGYLLAIQNTDGSVNLATGDISNNTETLHYFLPTFNLGFGIAPKKSIGFYTKAFYGHKIGSISENEAFFGIDLGILIQLQKRNQ